MAGGSVAEISNGRSVWRRLALVVVAASMSYLGLSAIDSKPAIAWQCEDGQTTPCPLSANLDGLTRVDVTIEAGNMQIPNCYPRPGGFAVCTDNQWGMRTTEPFCHATNVYADGRQVSGPCKFAASDGINYGIAPVTFEDPQQCLAFNFALSGFSGLHFFDAADNIWTIERTRLDRPGMTGTAVVSTLTPRTTWQSVMTLDGTAVDAADHRKKIALAMTGTLAAEVDCTFIAPVQILQALSGTGQVTDA